jgi:protoporphyrinogen oxidase
MLLIPELLSCTTVVKKSDGGLTSSTSSDPTRVTKKNLLKNSKGYDYNPIDRTLGEQLGAVYSGDQPDKTHKVLWSLEAYLKKNNLTIEQIPREKTKVVIVGGGMSGIISAHQLKKHNPIVLERADRFGGNAKGESWRGLDYSIGAAYFMEADDGSPIDQFYKDLGIYSIVRAKNEDDPILFKNQILKNFWEGETDPEAKDQFQFLAKYFKEVNEGKNDRQYPEIPPAPGKEREFVDKLDSTDFIFHIQETLKIPRIHPHIMTMLEHYCWSTFATPASEMSAAVALNAFAAEFGKVYVAAGGNARIAEHIMEKSLDQIHVDNFRAQSLVFKVKVEKNCVAVYYETAGEIKAIEAEYVVMACPKFVVKHILQDLEPERLQALQKFSYNSYLVANVLLDKEISQDYYDLYLLGDGKVNTEDITESTLNHKVTDVVFANYACKTKNQGILTLYRGFPFTGARATILSDKSWEDYNKEFQQQINEQILPALGLSSNDVEELRIARWGHPMPVAKPGMIAQKIVDKAFQPFADRVYFVEQDNWVTPAIETCLGEAFNWCQVINKKLG